MSGAHTVVFRNATIARFANTAPVRSSPGIELVRKSTVVVRDGLINQIGGTPPSQPDGQVIDCGGRVLMQGFVDCHTHACWVGSRLDEWQQRLAGASYLELLEAGGGIMSTVSAVRAADQQQLTDGLVERLDRMLAEGTTALEVKSGYGLDTATELKMLASIKDSGDRWPGLVYPTACIGHAKDPACDDPVGLTLTETLPAVSAEHPGVAIDAYCESGAWSLDECIRLFDRAMELGHPVRVHADQFNSLGMVEWAVGHGALSVDHLEASDRSTLEVVAASDTAAVLLPASGFHLDDRYADGRTLADLGAAIAIGTNCNPGSAPTESIPMVTALAVRRLGLTPIEALAACTTNAAWLLRRQADAMGAPPPPRGLAVGERADLVLLAWDDPRELAHTFGGRGVELVMAGGRVVHHAARRSPLPADDRS